MSAFGLLKQSFLKDSDVFTNPSRNDGLIDQLIPNGENVQLGKIQDQYYNKFKESSKDKVKGYPDTSKLLGFGWRWYGTEAMTFSVRRGGLREHRADVPPFLSTTNVEILLLFSPKTGEFVGLEVRLSKFKIIKIIKSADAKANHFKVEFCSDEAFWKQVYKHTEKRFGTLDDFVSDIRTNIEKEIGKSAPPSNRGKRLHHLIETEKRSKSMFVGFVRH